MLKFIIAVFFSGWVFSESSAQINHRKMAKAIICLTYDDGLASQLTMAIPQLDSVGLKATFFLNAIQGSSASSMIGESPEAVLGWTNAALNGHELANHTLFHPCPAAIGWNSKISIENYTVTRMTKEVETQNAILSLLDPRGTQRAFAFPCNNTLINDTNYVSILKRRKLISYARSGGDSSSIIGDFDHLDPLNVPSWHVWTGTSIDQLVSFANKVKLAGGMGVYQFHGVGGQVFQISPETHRAFLRYLKDHPDDFQVLPFSEAINAVSKSR